MRNNAINLLALPYVALSVLAKDSKEVSGSLAKFLAQKNLKLAQFQKKISVASFMGRIKPGVMHSKSIAIWRGDGFSAVMGNLEDGWISLCNVITADLSTSGMTLYTGGNDVDFPVCSFSYISKGATVRRVGRSLEDDGWSFVANGEEIIGENVSDYKNKPIGKRITSERIYEIAKENGFDIATLQEEGCVLFE